MKAEIETFQITPGSSSEASSTLSYGYVLMSSLLTSWCWSGLISAGSGNGLRGFPLVAETVPPQVTSYDRVLPTLYILFSGSARNAWVLPHFPLGVESGYLKNIYEDPE